MTGKPATSDYKPGDPKTSDVTLLVCTTCRRGDIDTACDKRPGTIMLRSLEAADLPGNVRLRGVECLSACTNGCTVALRGPGRWSYVYGNLDPALHVSDIVTGAAAYAATKDGLVPWRERPVVFRKQSIARIPPLEHDQ